MASKFSLKKLWVEEIKKLTDEDFVELAFLVREEGFVRSTRLRAESEQIKNISRWLETKLKKTKLQKK